MPQIYDMGRLYFPSEGGFEPANLGTKGQHATPRPPKPDKKITIALLIVYFTLLRKVIKLKMAHI